MKKISFLFFVFFLVTSVLVAQTPQYYNFANGTVSNMFPLNVPSGKLSQTVVPAATFITPSPAPAGNITKLYFRISGNLKLRCLNFWFPVSLLAAEEYQDRAYTPAWPPKVPVCR